MFSNNNNKLISFESNSIFIPNKLYYHIDLTESLVILKTKGRAYWVSFNDVNFYIPISILINSDNKIYVHERIFKNNYEIALKKSLKAKNNTNPLFVSLKGNLLPDKIANKFVETLKLHLFYEVSHISLDNIVHLRNGIKANMIYFNFHKVEIKAIKNIKEDNIYSSYFVE